MRLTRKLATLVLTAVAVIGLVGTGTTPASAATGKNGVVEVGEFGLYYVTGSSGLVFDLFVSAGAGTAAYAASLLAFGLSPTERAAAIRLILRRPTAAAP